MRFNETETLLQIEYHTSTEECKFGKCAYVTQNVCYRKQILRRDACIKILKWISCKYNLGISLKFQLSE